MRNLLGKKTSVLAAAVVLTAALTGCMTNQQRAQQAPQAPAVPITPPRTQGDMNRANQNLTQTNSNFRDAQNIANALVGKDNIRDANVFVTDSTAYVAVDIVRPGEAGTTRGGKAQGKGMMTDQIKQDIANEVRRVDPSIQRVFVSSDADTVSQFRGLRDEMRDGRPIQGMADRFREMVNRIWPEQK